MILRLMILAACAVGMALAGQKAAQGDDLKALCNGKSIKLTKLSELDSLIRKLDTDQGVGCPDRTASALRDLQSTVTSNRFEGCSMRAYENYRRYYKEYLDDSKKQKTEEREELHKSIRLFALAYGVSLSGACRLNMVNNLLNADLREAVEADFERAEIKDQVAPDGPIAQSLGHSSQRPDEMIFPDDFYSLLDAGKETTRESRTSLKVVATAAIKRLKTVCERRFAPVYKQVMLPVAKMANLGFDYRKSLLKHELKAALKDDSTRDLIGKWARVAFMCELISSVQLIQRAEDAKRSEGNDENLVQVCTRDGKCHFKKPEGEDLLETVEVGLDDIKPLEYKPNLLVNLEQQIYGSLGKAVAVSMVFTSFDEKTNVRVRFARKILRNLKKVMLSYNMKKFYKEAKTIMKGVMEANKQQTGPARTDVCTDLVSHMNEMISRELTPERAVACAHCEEDEAPSKVVWAIIAVIVLFVTIAGVLIATKPAFIVGGISAGG